MKQLHLAILLSVLVSVLSGCAYTATTVSNTNAVPVHNSNSITVQTNVNSAESASGTEFTPPTGGKANPTPATAGERRVLLARSTDGLHFTASGQILTDQANVPDMVVESDGTIRVYYIGQSIESGKEESTVVAISKDNGTTWTYHLLSFQNFPQPRDPSDPDVVLLADGTYRLYYTSSISSTQFGIVYADSPDGFTFTYKGVSLESFGDAVDSTTFFFNGMWHMFVLQEKVDGQLHATSTDGKTFTLVSNNNVQLPTDPYVLANPIVGEDSVRMFGFFVPKHNIRSFTSTDATVWTQGDIALDGDDASTLGTGYIQDCSVAQLQDGTYLMAYVSEMPKE